MSLAILLFFVRHCERCPCLTQGTPLMPSRFTIKQTAYVNNPFSHLHLQFDPVWSQFVWRIWPWVRDLATTPCDHSSIRTTWLFKGLLIDFSLLAMVTVKLHPLHQIAKLSVNCRPRISQAGQEYPLLSESFPSSCEKKFTPKHKQRSIFKLAPGICVGRARPSLPAPDRYQGDWKK